MAQHPAVTESARGIVIAFLAQFGLESLGDWAWGRYQALGGTPGAMDLIGIEMLDRPEFKQRFPAYHELTAKGRAMTPLEMVAYEKQVAGMMVAAGLPPGFYDSPEDFAGFMRGEVSVNEMQQRVAIAADAAFRAPVSVRQELGRLYQIGAGGLTAYFLDEKIAAPLLAQQYATGQLAGASRRTEFGLLTLEEAERLNAQGVDAAQAGTTFGQLAEAEDLLTGTLAEQSLGGGFTREETLEAGFEAGSAQQTRFQRRQERRRARFAGRSGFGVGQSGVSGLGSTTGPAG